jgi:hypothetical protein
VVVGRGCLGRPWLFAELDAALSGRPLPAAPRLGEVADVLLRHAELLVEDEGEHGALRAMRRQSGWYLQGFVVGTETRRRVSLVSTLDELRSVLADLDREQELPDGARRLKRGHTDGPRPVHLPDGWFDLADDPTPPVGAEVLVSGG